MGKHDARRQKQLAKKKAKREEKRAVIARSTSKDPTVRLAGASQWPVIDAIVADTLWTEGIGSVVISRQMPGGAIAVASFMVDVWCLGVKDAFWKALSSFEYTEFLRRLRANSPGSKETPEYAAKLILSAVAFARSFSFSPHPDFRHAKLLLAGIDPEKCVETFTFGRDGKPYYVRGPYESIAEAQSIGRRVQLAGGTFVIPTRGDIDGGEMDPIDARNLTWIEHEEPAESEP